MQPNFKSITIAPFLIFAEDPTSFKQTHAYQPNGPDSITKGYAILKDRGEDEVPEEIVAAADVGTLIIAAKALAAEYSVPFHRPEWLRKLYPEIISVQVIPFIEDSETANIQIQPTGPTAETSGWGVYLRKETGEAQWAADCGNEKDATFIGASYASHHGVEIEPQPWKQQ